MDLNIDNYSISDIFNILDITSKEVNSNNINLDLVQKRVQLKIDKIKETNSDILNEDKLELIDFFYKCLIKISTTFKQNNQNKIIEQDDHFIIKNKTKQVKDNFNVNVKEGIINPLIVKTVKQILNINTKFRDNYDNTTTTNFTINLPSTIKKIISLKLFNYQLPDVLYNGTYNYILLCIDDFQNNHNSIYLSPIKYQSLADNNIIAKIACKNEKYYHYYEYPKRIYFGPTDLNKINIKLLDEMGNIINIIQDYSFELECEILYDL